MQAAKLALGLLCGAHISAVQNEPVVGVMKHFGGEVARQHPLHTEWGGARRRHESDAVAHSEDVCIYCHGRLMEDDAEHDVGCLASHTGQAGELLHGRGHLAAVFALEHGGHPHQVSCLVVGVGYALDVFVDDFGRGK